MNNNCESSQIKVYLSNIIYEKLSDWQDKTFIQIFE